VRELGVTFPDDYREFMLAYNGGEPEPPYFVLRRDAEREREWVDFLCSITSSRIDSLSLRGQNEMVARWAAEGTPVPEGCIAIGSAPDGTILLFTKGRRKGQVWLKVWDDVPGIAGVPDDPEAGLYCLATSFRGFLESLCSEEEAKRRVGKA
jgi:hypothetical protein